MTGDTYIRYSVCTSEITVCLIYTDRNRRMWIWTQNRQQGLTERPHVECPRTIKTAGTFPHTYLLTYSMVQSPSWEANWFAASQEIPRISRNPKVHYRTHKRPPPVSILGQLNPVHIPTSHLLEFHPNIIHPSTPRSPQWSPSLRFPQQDPLHPLSSNYKVVSFKNTLGTTLYRLLKKSISQSLFPCHKQHSTSFQQLYILQCTLRVNDPNLNKLRTT